MKKIFSFTTFFLILLLPGAESQMTVSRKGKNYAIETAFAPGISLVQNLVDKSPEWPVNFATPYLKVSGKGKIELAYSHDDAAPWNFNKTYIGGNHGDSAGTQLIFQEGHGLTGKDCGSQWKTPQGRIFYILKVKDPKVLWILSDDLNKEKDLWSFDRVWAPPLVNVKDGRVLDKFKAKVCLLGSPVRINDLRFLADGKELKDNETRRCSKFTVEEEYDIVATDTDHDFYVRIEKGMSPLDGGISFPVIYSSKEKELLRLTEEVFTDIYFDEFDSWLESIGFPFTLEEYYTGK